MQIELRDLPLGRAHASQLNRHFERTGRAAQGAERALTAQVAGSSEGSRARARADADAPPPPVRGRARNSPTQPHPSRPALCAPVHAATLLGRGVALTARARAQVALVISGAPRFDCEALYMLLWGGVPARGRPVT